MARYSITRFLLPAILALAGCNTGGHTGPVDGAAEKDLLPFELTDGVTTREEIRRAFGNPSATFEGDRLWTYALLPGESGSLSVRPRVRDDDGYLLWEHESYNLILVFKNDVLKSHTLLRIS